MGTDCAERLKLLRGERGWTQNRLADELGMCRSNIANWEAGIRKPGIRTAVKLARIFNVSLDYILCRSDSRDESAPMILEGIDINRLNRRGIQELVSYYEYLLTKDVYTK